MRDAAGCEITDTVRIENTSGLTASLAETFDAPCTGVGSGSIRLNIGSGAASLTYSIDGGKTTAPATAGSTTIPGLSAGVYQIRVTDDAGCSVTLDGLNIDKEADFLQAVDNRVYTYINRGVSGYLIYDDYELYRYEYTVVSHTNPLHGTLTVAENGAFTYTATEDFVGKDSLQYTVANGCGLRSTAWLFIDLSELEITGNRPPIAMDDDYGIKAGQSLSNFEVRKNDLDPDGGVLTESVVVSGVLRGTLTQNGNGTFNYTPFAGFAGTDVFTYRVCDAEGLCNTAQTHINVFVSDHYTVALPDAYTLPKYDTLRVTIPSAGLLANDIYPQGSVPVITVVDSAVHGAVTLNAANGTFTYAPDLHYSGPDAFTYLLCTDASAECDTAWVNIFVAERPCPLPVTLSVTDTLTICAGDSVNLNTAVLPTSANIDTVMFFKDKLYQIPLAGAFAKTEGMYYIQALNTYKCSEYDSVYVKVNPLPTVTIDGLDNACTGDRVMFSVLSEMSNYLWTVAPDGITEGVADADLEYFTWNAAGTKTISVTVTDDKGCKKTAMKNIVIELRPSTGPIYRAPNGQ